MSVSGIYAISHAESGRFYIGSAVRVRRRWCEHRRSLEKGTHHSRFLQRMWDKYGAAAFDFAVVEPVERREDLAVREQFWIDRFNPALNSCMVVGSQLGMKRTDETKAKMRKARVGKKHKPESIEKIKAWKHDDHHREKMSIAHRGVKRSPEVCAAISAGLKRMYAERAA